MRSSGVQSNRSRLGWTFDQRVSLSHDRTDPILNPGIAPLFVPIVAPKSARGTGRGGSFTQAGPGTSCRPYDDASPTAWEDGSAVAPPRQTRATSRSTTPTPSRGMTGPRPQATPSTG